MGGGPSAEKNERDARYKAIQEEKASRFGGRSRLPVCKACFESHVRCPGPEIDENDNYDYDKKCLRCINDDLECDFKSKMSSLARRTLDAMTEEERSIAMRTNKERGRMHPREATMHNHPRRRRLNHSDRISSRIPASHLSGSAIRARELQPSSNTSNQPFTTQPFATQPVAIQPLTTQLPTTQPFITQPFTTQPPTIQPPTIQPFTTQPFTTQPPITQPFTPQLSSLILPDGRLVEYTAQPSQVILPDGRIIEYTIVPAEHVDNATREHAYEATSHDIAQAIQEQEDRRMAHRLPPQSMYPDPSAYEEAPTTPLW
ncbi:hypothetical protein EPUS_07812 [Endocarpon pusillum Z07020]|uniref:Zn(2)-C6 fungal-type domain-containing protein n=1 Tax=Endocarpon pusillum (strain Z07020 / HMAS-L-300199) TaxID=1263415 RepID=U1GRY9_ENDPU|nr:uncharacterized protein EPUS_07812 [Endocarpon pusillum Z07020]ERF75123.1 hypothetical protein EPUS_07812 [Endocarpon pusillum Z07020]